MESDYSKAALVSFLGYIVEKGLINAQTGKAWRIAASKLLTDLSEAEEADVRTIDVDVAARKFANRNPSALSPKSLSDYRQRVAAAIHEFANWRSDPTAYKPRGISGKPRAKQSENGATGQERRVASKTEAPKSAAQAVPTASGGLPLSYPLRPDFLAQVVIPRDMKVDEAKRLGAFLMTLATDFSPG